MKKLKIIQNIPNYQNTLAYRVLYEDISSELGILKNKTEISFNKNIHVFYILLTISKVDKKRRIYFLKTCVINT